MEPRPIELEIIGRKLILKMPKNEADIKFVRSIQYARWNKEGFFWEVPHYPGNLEMIKGYFGNRLMFHFLKNLSIIFLKSKWMIWVKKR